MKRRGNITVAQNTFWLLGGHGLRMGLGLIVTVWLARYLGPDSYGTYSFTIAFVAMFSQLSALGLNSILVRDIVRARDQTNEILGTAFILRIIGGSLTFLAAVGIIWLLEPSDSLVQALVAIYAFGSIFRAFEVIDQFFQSKVESKYVVLAKIGSYLVVASTTIALIIGESTLVAFVTVKAAEVALFAAGLLAAYTLRGYSVFDWSLDVSRGVHLLRQSWPLILSGFGAVIYLKIDQVMLAKVVNYTAVGHYAVAVQLSEIWYVIPTAIVSSVFPALVRSKEGSAAEYERKLQRLYDFLIALAVTISFPLSIFSGDIVALLYGSEYAPASAILTIHIWASVFIFMRAALSKWLIMENLFVFSLVTHGAGAFTNIGLNIWLIPSFGGEGAAVATVISYAMASYGALLFHYRTREAMLMMTRALFVPFRAARRTVRALA